MNNYYLIGGTRKGTSYNHDCINLAGHFTKKNPEREISAVSGYVVDNYQLAELVGRCEKNKMHLGLTYHGFASPLKLKLEFDKKTDLWVGSYFHEHDKSNVGIVKLKVISLEEEVEFVPPHYRGLPKNISKKKNL